LFGYIRPYKPELKIREFEEYKGYYCTLCKTLEKEYGFFAKFFLNYDFAFLALLLSSLEEEKTGFKRASCTFNPLKKCNFCEGKEDTFGFVSDVSILFLYYKLKDNIKDEHFLKKAISFIVKLFISGAYKKAAQKQPAINELIGKAMEKQSKIENLSQITVYQAAEPSATLLGEVMSYPFKDEKKRRILYEFGFHLGKWIYLIDALDDYKKDFKNNSFNPFIKSNGVGKDYEEVKKEAGVLLEECIIGYENAFLLLDSKNNQYILENILFEGNPSTYYQMMKKESKCNE
jgi:hypothetical protein